LQQQQSAFKIELFQNIDNSGIVLCVVKEKFSRDCFIFRIGIDAVSTRKISYFYLFVFVNIFSVQTGYSDAGIISGFLASVAEDIKDGGFPDIGVSDEKYFLKYRIAA